MEVKQRDIRLRKSLFLNHIEDIINYITLLSTFYRRSFTAF